MGKKLREFANYWVDCIKKDWVTTLIIAVAFALYMVVIMPSGSRYCFDGRCGIYFWGAHEHDAIWHLALIEAAFDTIPFRFPVLAGQALGGYNYLLDIVLYILSLAGTSASNLYFKVQPVLWFGVFVFLLYHAGRLYRDDKGYIRWLFFFVFFSTSFGVLIPLFKHQTLFGSVGIPTMQGALSMTNPQFMWSLCVLLGIWIITQKDKWTKALPFLVFAGLGLKFYVIVPASILIIWYIGKLLVSKQIKKAVTTLMLVSLGTTAAYLVFYAGGSSGGLIWKPLEITHQIVEDKNLWYDEIMVQQRYFIQQLGHVWSPRLWWIEIRTIWYFIFFNFGLRLVGVLGGIFLIMFRRKHMGHLVPLVLIVIASTCMPILFIQKGTWWNSIQFLYYAIFAAGVLAAEFVWWCCHKRSSLLTWAVGLLCIAAFLPTNYETVTLYTSHKNVRYIPDEEVQALTYLRSLPDGVVLTQSFRAKESSILAENYDTAYVTAFSGKPMFLADRDQLNLLGISYQEDLKTLTSDPCSFIAKVQYVYIRTNAQDKTMQTCVERLDTLERVFQNKTASVWKVR